MKKIILVLFLLAAVNGSEIYGQIIFSNGTGGGVWNNTSTWSGGVVPGIGNDVIIQASDSVQSGSGNQCNNLTVQGILATSNDSLQVAGALTLESGSFFYNQVQEKPELPGTVYNIDPSSTVVHVGSGTVGGPDNLEFGNLIILRTAGCTAGGDLNIMGNLTLQFAGHNMYFRVSDDESGSQTCTVQGNVYIEKGTLSAVDVGALDGTTVGIWNIKGDVFVYGSGAEGAVQYDARIGPFSSASPVGLAIINIDGDFIIDGGRLQAGTSSTFGTGTGIVNLKGDLTISGNSTISTNHLGDFALNFTGNSVQTVTFGRNFSMSTNVYDTVKSGASVALNFQDSTWGSSTGGEFVVNGTLDIPGESALTGAGSFKLYPGAALKIGSADGITNSDASGNIQMTGARNYSEDANYEYKGNSTQVFGNGLPSTFNGLTINNPNGLSFGAGHTAGSSVNIINGDLDLGGTVLTLAENAVLSESPGNTVKGDGKITITKNISIPTALNVGGLGAELTSSSDLGSTTIERIHLPAMGNGNAGIMRQYNIMPGQNNSGLDATLRLYYDESELNGLSEDGLRIFKSADGSDESWGMIGGTENTTDNYVEATGIADFSYWTIANLNTTLPVEDGDYGIPQKFALLQNYPNPFNPETVIRFEIPKSAFINISVYNLLGEKVSEILNENIQPGVHFINFNPAGLAAGVYIYKLTADEFTFSKKMIYLK